MVRSALTSGDSDVQPRWPKPFCMTAAPRRPITTEAPGYPPAVMPRRTTRSMVARRSADMPTARGDRTGSFSVAAASTRARARWATNGLLLQRRAIAPTSGDAIGIGPQRLHQQPAAVHIDNTKMSRLLQGREMGSSTSCTFSFNCRFGRRAGWSTTRKLRPLLGTRTPDRVGQFLSPAGVKSAPFRPPTAKGPSGLGPQEI